MIAQGRQVEAPRIPEKEFVAHNDVAVKPTELEYDPRAASVQLLAAIFSENVPTGQKVEAVEAKVPT